MYKIIIVNNRSSEIGYKYLLYFNKFNVKQNQQHNRVFQNSVFVCMLQHIVCKPFIFLKIWDHSSICLVVRYPLLA